MRAVVISIDKYHFREPLIGCRASTKQILKTLSEILRADVEILTGKGVTRDDVLNKIRIVGETCKRESDQMVLFYFGQSQLLDRGKSETFLALPSDLPGRTKSAITISEVLGAVPSDCKHLLFVDATVASVDNRVSLTTVDAIRATNGVQVIAAADSTVTAQGGNSLSLFSLLVDRAFRHAADSYGNKQSLEIATRIVSDFEKLGRQNAVRVYSGDPELEVKFEIPTTVLAKVGGFNYLVDNIYNYSAGSRSDGVNELESLYRETESAELKKAAEDRLRYIVVTDPDLDVRRQVAAVLFREASNQISLNELTSAAVKARTFEFVEIPAGQFVMGTCSPELGETEYPEHALVLERYRISKHLVTVAQYLQFVVATNANVPLGWTSCEIVRKLCDHPVTGVSWHEACSFCMWLTDVLKKGCAIGDEEVVRLPTEAEWEKAARGCDGRLFPWGNVFDRNRCNVKSSGILKTTPVGMFSPHGDSPFGCTDMIGNVREWTASLWGQAGNVVQYRYPYRFYDGREQLSAPDSFRRILRGGGYYYDDECANVVVRNRAYPHNKHPGGGFRFVVSNKPLR